MRIIDKENLKIISSQKIEEKNYWLENLSGELEKTSFPCDYRNLKAKDFRREMMVFALPRELSSTLMQVGKNSDIRLHIILAAAVVILLKKYTGSSDIILVSPIYKQQTEGRFINTLLVLRNRLHKDITFKELLRRVGQTVKNANENQNYPLETLMDQLNIPFPGNECSLFDTAVLLENIHDKQYIRHIKWNMILSFLRTGTSITGTVEYNPLLYKKTTIERMVGHLENLFYHVLRHPNLPESDITMLSEDEKKQLLFDFNDTCAQYPGDKVIGTLFAEQVEKAPHHIAVACEDANLTYGELDKRANHAAGGLKAKGVAAETIVGLLLHRSPEMLTTILGILKAGGAYLPIDPDYPRERIRYMLEDSSAKILVTAHGLSGLFEKLSIVNCQLSIVNCQREIACSAQSNSPLERGASSTYLKEFGGGGVCLNLQPEVNPSNLAYIIYTSGTTGKPKGVLIEHRNVVRLLFNDGFQFNFNAFDTWTMFHSYCFDFSVWEMYGALLYGGKLVVIPKWMTRDPAGYLGILKQRRVTVLNQTPTAFYNLAAEELKQPGKALCLKYVIFGGEALNPLHLKDWQEKYPETKLINMFGITETTVHVTYKEIGQREIRLNMSNIGTPIPTLCTYVMDKNLALKPIGAAGEMCVGGQGVGRGYLNRPELTKEKFVENPHKPGERLYKSGDLVKLSDTGEMEYLGRIDHQVQVRGFRVELGEIQAHLLKHEEIKKVLVLPLEGENGDKSLCAYIVSHKALEVSALREYLTGELPDYMIPAYFVRVEQIPLTSNGKVDRKMLPHPKTTAAGTIYTAPRNEIEETLASIWANHLGLEQVGIHEDYFNSGGDSIKAIKLLNSINDAFQINLKIVDLFAHETIEKLAGRISRDETGSHHDLAVERRDALQEIEALKARIMAALQPDEHIEDIYPMSDIEKGMVYYTLKDPADAAYHDQMVYHVKYRDFNPQTFKRALHLMAKKHPILRTSFHIEDYEEPVQLVRESIDIDMEHLDISHMNREEQTLCINQFLIKDRKKGFDPAKAPLWRIRTFQLANEYVCAAMVTHHAVLDGWSVAAFLTELNNTYLKVKIEPDFILDQLASTYKDFILEQILEKKTHHAHDYWRKELENYKRLDFPERKRVKTGETFTTAKGYSMNLGKNLLEELKKCALQMNTTLKRLCLSAYIYMLNMLSYENDIVVGIVNNGRPVCTDGDKILGCFLNTVPFRLKIPTNTTWEEYIGIVNRKQLEFEKYNRVSLFQILRIIGENPRDSNPIFDTIFNFVDFHVYEQVKYETYEKYEKSKRESTEPLPVDGYVKSNTLLDFSVNLTLGGFNLSVNYTNSSFGREEVRTLCDYFLRIVKAFVSEPRRLMSKDKIISPEDREKLLFTFNQTVEYYPQETTIHKLFENQAEQRPDHVALIGQIPNSKFQIPNKVEPFGQISNAFGEMNLSYGELNKKSNQLAHLLHEKGVKSDTVVAIMMERSLEMIIGVFGILKAGGAYLPIDPDYPEDRINYMLKDTKVSILVKKDKKFRVSPKMQEGQGLFVLNFEHLSFEFVPDFGFRVSDLNSSKLAYVIYTSGSTGKPKGVAVQHSSVVNLVLFQERYFNIDEKERILQFSPLSFDASVGQIFVAFSSGAVLVLIEKSTLLNNERFEKFVNRHFITHIHAVPSFLNNIQFNHFNSLKRMISGGEVCPVDLAGRWGTYCDFCNEYGPTETTVASVMILVKALDREEIVPIGKPIANTFIYLLDAGKALVPPGVTGELYIGGAGVTRGYLNRPQLTAERFCLRRPGGRFLKKLPPRTPRKNFLLSPVLQYPIPPSPHSPIYMTGDLARWRGDGNMEFLGRIDHQVKIRGFRIEPGEIQGRLKDHPEIKEAVVVVSTTEAVNNNSHKETYLCAYFVTRADKNLPVSQLREYLLGYLPDYMVPSYYIRVDKMPLTHSGKLNRKALPHPGIASDQPYSAPNSDKEKKLVEIWAQVLNIKPGNPGLEVIGIDDNFFQLGGHSLTAVILASKIHKAFDVRVSLEELFKIPTIREIAVHIKTAQPDKFSTIRSVEKKEYYPLTSAQKRMYFLQQMSETGTVYNIPFVIRLQDHIDMTRLGKAGEQLIQRHESFRTSFFLLEAEAAQRIHPEVKFEIEYYDMKGADAAGGPRPAADIISSFIRPFDLSCTPLLRMGLVKTMEEEHILVTDMHHIISDGISFGILVKDFMLLYNNSELPLLRCHYKDFSQWQHFESQKETFKQQQEYWIREYAEEIPVLHLPTDYTRPAIQGFEGSTVGFAISPEETGALKKYSLQQGATLFMVLLAVYYVFLSKITNQEDIVIGTPTAGRRHADLEKIIGIFINTLALRNYPSGEKKFIDFLGEVKEKGLEAFENQDYQYEDLVEQVPVNRDTGRNPLFDTMFVLHNTGNQSSGIPGLRISPYEYENKTSKFDLTLSGVEAQDKMSFNFEYCTKLFKQETIERYGNNLKKIVTVIIGDPGIRLGNIEIITAEEKQRVLYEFNRTEADYPREMTIHGLFASQVQRTPDHAAVIGIEHGAGSTDKYLEGTRGLAPLPVTMSVTYNELNERSKRLAHLIKEKRVEPGTIVAIMPERSLEMIIGILGILKAGGAYLPIDPDYPEERINYMLKDSNARILVSTAGEVIEVSSSPCNSPLERGASSTSVSKFGGGGVCLNLQPGANPSNLAYIIYTSGTTGRPKGVLIEHRHVVRLMFNDKFLFDFGGSDIWTMFHSFCFDFSVWEMYGALLYGGKLVLIPAMTARDPEAYLEILKREKVTVVNQTPSAFYSLITAELDRPGKNLYIKYVIFGGEALSPIRLKEWKTRYPQVKLINMYGITETTVHVTFKELSHHEIESNISNIGKPIPTLSTYVMDKDLKLLPIGVPGELSVGGLGVARGYLNRPQLTGEKFPVNPYKPGEILYRSGDLVRLNPDGEMEYLGRIDQQVKIRGFRIELGEIENQLMIHKEIKEVVVVFKEENQRDRYLCAYFVSAKKLEVTGLREYLSGKLPGYMVPSFFVQLDQIPVTPNGKVDRRTLPEPDIEPGEDYIAPRGETEKELLEIWAQLLGFDKEIIGVDDNFFQLGGHSLKATLLASRIHKHFHKKIPLAEIFIKPTIREMAAYINEQKEYTYSDIAPVEKKDYYVLSSAQKRLFILYQINPGDLAYNITSMMTLEGEVDKYGFEGIFQKIINRHESLRTSFHVINEQPMQRILDELEFNIEYYDLASYNQDTGPGNRKQAIIDHFIRWFDFSQAPLLRVALIKTGENTHIFMADIHHIISDGISLAILIKEFLALYNGDILPGMKIQYKDYSQWQNQLLESGEMRKQENYWLNQFAGEIPVLNMLTDYKRPGKMRIEGESIFFEISKELTGQLKEITQNTQTTLYTILLAVYTILLSKYTGQDDIVVGSGVAGRNHTDLENIIGMFINMIAVKNQPGEDKTFGEFLEEIKECTLKAFENQDYPFDELVKKLGLQGNWNRNPLFDTQFTFQNIPQEPGKISGLTSKPYQSPKQPIQFDLSLNGLESGETITMALTYWRHVFKRETIEKMANHFIEILEQSLENLDMKIGDITLSHQLIAGKSDFSKNDAMSFGF